MNTQPAQAPKVQLVSTPFRCTMPVQIRYTDIDIQGHVNNSIYLNIFDMAKLDYFARVKGENLDWKHVNIVIASMKLDFLSPTLFNDHVEACTQMLKIGNKSFTLLHQLVDARSKAVKCQCTTTMVYLDDTTLQPSPVPQYWRDAIAQYEGRPF